MASHEPQRFRNKHDRSALETFGSYIDTYTIEQAVADGATVP